MTYDCNKYIEESYLFNWGVNCKNDLFLIIAFSLILLNLVFIHSLILQTLIWNFLNMSKLDLRAEDIVINKTSLLIS
jgi:hypothetical protein